LGIFCFPPLHAAGQRPDSYRDEPVCPHSKIKIPPIAGFFVLDALKDCFQKHIRQKRQGCCATLSLILQLWPATGLEITRLPSTHVGDFLFTDISSYSCFKQ
jgi:hypothetical protein